MTITHSAALLAAILVLYTQVGHAAIRDDRLRRYGLGLVLGAASIFTMSTPVDVSPGIIVDGRTILMALAGLFAGPIGTTIAAAMAVVFRLYLGGVGAPTGAATILVTAGTGFAAACFLARTGRPLRYVHLVVLGAVVVVMLNSTLLLLFPIEGALTLLRSVGLPLSLVTFIGIPLFGGLLLQEDRRAALEARLTRSEAQYRLLASHSTDMISRFEPNFQRTYVSPASKRLFGYEPDELLGERTVERIHPDDVPAVESAARLVQSAAGRATVQYRFRHQAGYWVWVEATLAKSVDLSTGAVEIVSVARDIGERKRVEEQLREANAAKSLFLANMSHELRTPLNAVIGFAELIRDEIFGRHSSPKYREYGVHIDESGRHLLRLINDVLDLSKIEAGKMDLAEDTFRLPELVDSSVQLIAPRAKKNGITLACTIDPRVESACGDIHRLRQALLNLLSNAIKFTPAGGTVSVSIKADEAGQLVLCVRDTGCGIDLDDLEKLFQPFSQVGDLLMRRVEGTGLGLTLTRDLIELHGGRAWLESELGVGTAAFLTLPAARVTLRQRPVRLAS